MAVSARQIVLEVLDVRDLQGEMDEALLVLERLGLDVLDVGVLARIFDEILASMPGRSSV